MQSGLERLLDGILAPFGFRKTGVVWRKRNAENIEIVGLQKSSFGLDWYINLGVFFPGLDDKANPLPQHCHVQVRLNRIHPDPEALERVLLDGDYSPQNVGSLKWGFVEANKRFFETFKTLECACQFLTGHTSGDFLISAPLYDYWKSQDE